MIVTTGPVGSVVVDTDSFAGLTSAPIVSINWTGEGLQIEFDGDLTPAEVLAVQVRAESYYANKETLRTQAIAAMQGNRDFLAIPGTPTQVQVLAQVKALTRQNNGVMRMLLGLLDGTD